MRVEKAFCINEQKHAEGVEQLLAKIADKHNKSRGDIVVAYLEDVSVYNVRQWLCRPIPRKHWDMLSELSGFTMEKIEKIATQNFEVRRTHNDNK